MNVVGFPDKEYLPSKCYAPSTVLTHWQLTVNIWEAPENYKAKGENQNGKTETWNAQNACMWIMIVLNMKSDIYSLVMLPQPHPELYENSVSHVFQELYFHAGGKIIY